MCIGGCSLGVHISVFLVRVCVLEYCCTLCICMLGGCVGVCMC